LRTGLTLLLILFTAVSAFGSGQQESAEITVFAAASTSDLITAAAAAYTAETGTAVKLSAASSGTLARQIEQGAAPDIYISASEQWAVYLEDLQLLQENCSFLGNSLVLVAPSDSALQPFNLTEESPLPEFSGRISIGDPDHAPAGRYAVEAMTALGWIGELEPRLQPGADVRRALSVVEFGEAELGIVYKTDAILSSKVKIIAEFPESTHSPIRYYIGLVTGASAAGIDFYKFLTESGKAASIIRGAGFSL